MERRDAGQILDDAAPDVADDHLRLEVAEDVKSVGDDQEKADGGKKAGEGEGPEGRAGGSRPDDRKEGKDVGESKESKHRLIEVVFKKKGDEFGGVIVGGEGDSDSGEGEGGGEQDAEGAVCAAEEVEGGFGSLGERPEGLRVGPEQGEPNKERADDDGGDRAEVEGLGLEGCGGGLFDGGEDLGAVHPRSRAGEVGDIRAEMCWEAGHGGPRRVFGVERGGLRGRCRRASFGVGWFLGVKAGVWGGRDLGVGWFFGMCIAFAQGAILWGRKNQRNAVVVAFVGREDAASRRCRQGGIALWRCFREECEAFGFGRAWFLGVVSEEREWSAWRIRSV